MEQEPMKAVGADMGLDVLVARYFVALGKDLELSHITLSAGEVEDLILLMRLKSALMLSTEN